MAVVTADGGASFCSADATRLYVMDTAGVLYSFDPTLLTARTAFRKIGTMNCSWAGAGSMAIDRNAVAWVTDRAGMLFKVSTADARCESTPFRQQHAFTKVGMGFAGDIERGTETLYVVDNSDGGSFGSGMGLASIDLASFQLTPIANFSAPFFGFGAELTGAGDGRLFGFFPANGSLAQIDPSNGQIGVSNDVALYFPTSGSGEYDFAVSFWGGVFFFYTANTQSPAGPTTDVTVFDPATGETRLVASQIGFNITGAGSSTCVPRSAALDQVLGGSTLIGRVSSLDAGAGAERDSSGSDESP